MPDVAAHDYEGCRKARDSVAHELMLYAMWGGDWPMKDSGATRLDAIAKYHKKDYDECLVIVEAAASCHHCDADVQLRWYGTTDDAIRQDAKWKPFEAAEAIVRRAIDYNRRACGT